MRDAGIPIKTVAGGFFKPGLEGHACYSGVREVFLGESLAPTKIPEYTVVLTGGSRREFCQAGKDFEFAPRSAAVRAS